MAFMLMWLRRIIGMVARHVFHDISNGWYR
jgi:hypothetical protein